MSDHSGSSLPGWYHAEGDPPGTHRYWDGQQWRGVPQVIGTGGAGAVPPTPVPDLGGRTPPFAEGSQAVTALLSSVFGVFCCGLPAGVGWYLGQQEIQRIDQGLRDPSNRNTATAAKVIGIIAIVVWGALYLLWLLGLAFFTG